LEGAIFSGSQAAPEGGGGRWRGIVAAADRDTLCLFPETGVVNSGVQDNGLAESGTADGEDFGGGV